MAAFTSDGGGDGDDPGDDEEEPLEWVNLDEDLSYLGPFLRTLAIVHTLLSFSIMVAYYVLKVIAMKNLDKLRNKFLFLNVGALHFIYHISRLASTKVGRTNLD